MTNFYMILFGLAALVFIAPSLVTNRIDDDEVRIRYPLVDWSLRNQGMIALPLLTLYGVGVTAAGFVLLFFCAVTMRVRTNAEADEELNQYDEYYYRESVFPPPKSTLEAIGRTLAYWYFRAICILANGIWWLIVKAVIWVPILLVGGWFVTEHVEQKRIDERREREEREGSW